MAVSQRPHPRRWVPHILVIGAVLQSCPVHSASNDLQVLKQHYIEYLVASVPSADRIGEYLKSLRPDGTWPDIDYQDQNRSGWKTVYHLGRISEMAQAYRKTSHACAGTPDLKTGIQKALKHWLDHDYKNPNWWYNNIGAPMAMADILVLMGDDVPGEMVRRAMSSTLSRAKIGMTGQNKVWLAGIVFVRCLTEGNEKELKESRDVLLSEVRVTTQEGIQPDWSFHQHGPQQQFGNYGSAFGSCITQWANIFRDTTYALNDRQLPVLRNYLLEGPSWILWKGRMDLSGCGRQVSSGCQAGKGRGIVGQLKRMQEIDPANAAVYRQRVTSNEADGTNTLIGNKMFWRSDLMVHRRPDWYASVKMSSQRVIGAETCNSENMLGLHLGDGALYIYRTGDEYKDIQPLWDWHRLPGTTCDQSVPSLVPGKKQCMLPTQLVGGVSDGVVGVAALDFKRDALRARKTWFFEGDAIVCLGANVNAERSGPVFTSIQQSLLQGPVLTASGEVRQGTHALKPGDWIHHAGIGYLILNGDRPVLKISEQKGDWRQIFTTRKSSPATGEVFNLWFNHGESPQGQAYAYVILPQASLGDMPKRAKELGFRILHNAQTLQAIETADGVRAVFYEAGKLEWSGNRSIETDKPCLVILRRTATGTRLYVAEPTQRERQVQLRVDGHPRLIELPSGGEAGRTVEVEL